MERTCSQMVNMFITAALSSVALSAAVFAEQTAAPPAADPLLELEAIAVTPQQPAPDTLCQLQIKLRNHGTQTASRFGFRVTINGVVLPAYEGKLFLVAAAAEATTEIPFYSFWTTETSRPAPEDGQLRLEVELHEAWWLKIDEDEDGSEVWTPLDEVAGLPISRSLTVPLGSDRR